MKRLCLPFVERTMEAFYSSYEPTPWFELNLIQQLVTVHLIITKNASIYEILDWPCYSYPHHTCSLFQWFRPPRINMLQKLFPSSRCEYRGETKPFITGHPKSHTVGQEKRRWEEDSFYDAQKGHNASVCDRITCLFLRLAWVWILSWITFHLNANAFDGAGTHHTLLKISTPMSVPEAYKLA